MKTSTLIESLQRITKTTPFDAKVVTHDAETVYPIELKAVKHEPPHTYLEFESHIPDGKSAQELLQDLRWLLTDIKVIDNSTSTSEQYRENVQQLLKRPSLSTIPEPLIKGSW